MSTSKDCKPSSEDSKLAPNFIRNIVAEDLKNNKNDGKVVTRFPPEPNGYLHIGHAKALCLDFGIASENNGVCHLRFDDTNPVKEDPKYVEVIKADIKWLGFDWGKHLYYASDYFEKLYEFALQLIKVGKAYVCDLSAEEIRKTRGTLTEPGQESTFRNRSVEENLDLFERMRAGEFDDGTRVLRAKIDMASPNMNMRDPTIYRIRKSPHQRTGDKWCIYPMYDYTHCLSDSIEGITHSLCSLEFEDHRPLYDWFLDELKTPCHPQQIEFARLNINFTVMSKRKLLELVEGGHVSSWDDPRMLSLVGLRRRGYTADSIRNFTERIGIGKKDSLIDMGILEDCIRNDLNEKAPRVMCVLNPLKVIIDNYPEGKTEDLEATNHPNRPEMGSRKVPFSRIIYIERDDFLENPTKKFFRLGPGREVRLKYAYFIKCEKVLKDEITGEIKELHCSYDPETRGGSAPDGRKVKGTLHWVSSCSSIRVDVCLYDRLFKHPNPASEDDFKAHLNPNSLKILKDSLAEPSLKGAEAESKYQFERQGYFCVDKIDSSPDKLVFNRVVTLRDSWAKILREGG